MLDHPGTASVSEEELVWFLLAESAQGILISFSHTITHPWLCTTHRSACWPETVKHEDSSNLATSASSLVTSLVSVALIKACMWPYPCASLPSASQGHCMVLCILLRLLHSRRTLQLVHNQCSVGVSPWIFTDLLGFFLFK